MNSPITRFLGDPVLLIHSSLSTGVNPASNNLAGIPVAGWEGVLFIQIAPMTSDAGAGGDHSKMDIVYSATSNASDAVTSNTFFSNTDVCFPNASDATYTVNSDAGRLAFIDLPFSRMRTSLSSNATFWGTTGTDAAAVSTDAYILLGIPYGKDMTRTKTVSWKDSYADTNTVK